MGRVVHINQKQKKRRAALVIIVFAVLALLLVWLNSGFFAVKTIEIDGNERVSDEAVLQSLNMEKGMNLIGYCLHNRKQQFELDPLISRADIFIHWPDSVKVEIEERKAMGYLPYMGLYLCVDALGSVIGSVHHVDEGTPVLTGVSVDGFSLGEPVATSNTERFAIMLDGLSILEKYGLNTVVRKISVASPSDILLYTDTLEIRCGTKDDLDRKIAIAASVLEDGSCPSGILHVEEPDGQVYVEERK